MKPENEWTAKPKFHTVSSIFRGSTGVAILPLLGFSNNALLEHVFLCCSCNNSLIQTMESSDSSNMIVMIGLVANHFLAEACGSNRSHRSSYCALESQQEMFRGNQQ